MTWKTANNKYTKDSTRRTSQQLEGEYDREEEIDNVHK